MAEHALTRSREFAAKHPDFNESLNRAHAEGHTLANESVEHLKQKDRLDVGYWLSLPENRLERDYIHNLSRKPNEQIAELDKIAAKLDASRSMETELPSLSPVDAHLAQRRQDLKSGKRRR